MGKFTSESIDLLRKTILKSPMGRFPVTKHLPNDLHLKGTERLRNLRTASIFVPLCNRDGEASILYTLRTETVRTHKGQVSFPGGMIEEGESVEDAAIRETIEEIGGNDMTSDTIGRGSITILGLGQTVYSVTGVLVTPVVGVINSDVGDLSHFIPAADEVEKIFTRSIKQLNSPGYKEYETYEKEGRSVTMPVYGGDITGAADAEGELSELLAPDGDLRWVRRERIWGLTGMISEAVLSIINEHSILR